MVEFIDSCPACQLVKAEFKLSTAEAAAHNFIGSVFLDLVLLDVDCIPLLSLGLLSPRWKGPFSIVAQTAPNTYKLTLPAAWKVVNKFNV